jgi:hypothetical protein
MRSEVCWPQTPSGLKALEPEPGLDVIGGNIIVEVALGAQTFTVTYSGQVDHYSMWGTPQPAGTGSDFAWSKRSNVFHLSSCAYVA